MIKSAPPPPSFVYKMAKEPKLQIKQTNNSVIRSNWRKAPQYFCAVYHSTKARDFCVGELETRSNPLLLLLLLSSTTVIFF